MKNKMSENTNKKVVTRFAPSPTGFMHVGGVRTALFAWLLARKNKGTFILRIEDTDKKREVEGSIGHIQKSLKWLQLNWDEGPDIGGPNAPYLQSQRLDSYKQYAQKLIEKGLAYTDPYSEEELENFRQKAENEKRPFLYREYRPENPSEWDGTKPLRFKITDLKKTIWNDAVRGELSAGPEALDDFILIKSDGYPTYNFCHIIDDIEMGVTHVVRGQEFISSTPKFLAVYEALGILPPIFVTVPPLMGEGGTKKLGKRDGAKDLLEYEKEGYLPDAMINYLVLLGFNPGGEKEIFTRDELIEVFDLKKVQHSSAHWNDDKLNWLNKEHIKMLPKDERNQKILDRLVGNEIIGNEEKLKEEKFMQKLFPIIFDRISKWGDIDTMVSEGELQYFWSQPKYEKEKLVWKDSNLIDVKKHLQKVLEILESAPNGSLDSIEKIKSLIFDYATEEGRGAVLWPLRVALSGKEKSPDPFTLIYILDREETVKRIIMAINKI
jgi:glutamyl-tRNA synthetase